MQVRLVERQVVLTGILKENSIGGIVAGKPH